MGYAVLLQKVENTLTKGSEMSSQGIALEDDPEYQLIVECNALSDDIENEIVIIHNFIRDKYRLKFPELESLVHHPIDYVRVVKKIGNEMDLTLLTLKDFCHQPLLWWFQLPRQLLVESHFQRKSCRRQLMLVIELLP